MSIVAIRTDTGWETPDFLNRFFQISENQILVCTRKLGIGCGWIYSTKKILTGEIFYLKEG